MLVICGSEVVRSLEYDLRASGWRGAPRRWPRTLVPSFGPCALRRINSDSLENRGLSAEMVSGTHFLKEIWTKDEPEFHGEFVNFDPIWSYPKPAQKPHPPILLGNNTPNGRQRVVEFCDGWFPIAARAGDLATAVADLHQRAEKAGRDPRAISVSIFWAKPEEDALREYVKVGAERAIFAVPTADRDTILPILDRYATLMRLFR